MIWNKKEVVTELRNHLGQGGTINDDTVDDFYRKCFDLDTDEPTDLEEVEQWAFGQGRD